LEKKLLFQIDHETRLDFSTPVQEHHCEMRLTPHEGAHQRLLSHALSVDPPADLHAYTDAFGNKVVYFNVMAPHEFLVTRVSSRVETGLENPFDYRLMTAAAEDLWYGDQLRRRPELWQYILHRSPATPALSSLDLAGLKLPRRDRSHAVQSSLLSVLDWIHDTLRYQAGMTGTHTPLHEALGKRAGVCQDFAHLFIALVRSWGLPARYAMGYMRGSVEGYDDATGEEATHAWAEVLVPGAGWRGFDPTNRLCVNDQYLSVAVGRDYLDAAPQRGTFKGSAAQEAPKVRVILQQQQEQTAQ
jgi:transglutaminase-like putative cysteine protease